MKILDPEKVDVGEPFTIELSEAERDALVIEGFRVLIAEKNLNVDVIASDKDKKCENMHDLTKDQEDYLINLGINSIIEKKIKESE